MNTTEQILNHPAHPSSDVRPTSQGHDYPLTAMPVLLAGAVLYRAYNAHTGYRGEQFYADPDLAIEEAWLESHAGGDLDYQIYLSFAPQVGRTALEYYEWLISVGRSSTTGGAS